MSQLMIDVWISMFRQHKGTHGCWTLVDYKGWISNFGGYALEIAG